MSLVFISKQELSLESNQESTLAISYENPQWQGNFPSVQEFYECFIRLFFKAIIQLQPLNNLTSST